MSTLLDNLRNLFSSTSDKIIGFEIGFSAIKIAYIQKDKKGKYKLLEYVKMPLNEELIIEDQFLNPEEISVKIKAAIKKLKIKPSCINLALYGPSCIIANIQISECPKEEIEDQVLWEAEQYLPFSVDDAEVSYDVTQKNSEGGSSVLMVATPLAILKNFTNLLEDCLLKVKILDVSIIALCNLFTCSMDQSLLKPRRTFIVIDFGAQKTLFLIYKDNTVIYSNEFFFGGTNITEEIQKKMSLSYMEAEELKVLGDANNNLPEEIVEIIDDVLLIFMSKLKKVFNFYMESNEDSVFEACYVTGGTIKTPGLLEHLKEFFNCEILLIDPFKNITYNSKKFTEKEIQAIVLEGAVVLGLALRGTET